MRTVEAIKAQRAELRERHCDSAILASSELEWALAMLERMPAERVEEHARARAHDCMESAVAEATDGALAVQETLSWSAAMALWWALGIAHGITTGSCGYVAAQDTPK